MTASGSASYWSPPATAAATPGDHNELICMWLLQDQPHTNHLLPGKLQHQCYIRYCSVCDCFSISLMPITSCQVLICRLYVIASESASYFWPIWIWSQILACTEDPLAYWISVWLHGKLEDSTVQECREPVLGLKMLIYIKPTKTNPNRSFLLKSVPRDIIFSLYWR